MPEKKVKLFLEDMSISSTYELLEWGKNDDELKEIATKKGLKVPSKDLSIFKCKYGMVDKQNLNKCTLPRKEVKKALKTLNGKAIDKDHLRRNTVGYWLDAELDDSDIIAYGAFWKSNFPEEYDEIKKRMSEGKMKISFEAWGDRVFKADGGYDLTDIEFAGGALLFDTQPAFPDAEVMSFANRTLEFAKIIEEKEVETDGGSSSMKTDTKLNKAEEIKLNIRKLAKVITEELYTTVETPKEGGYDTERKCHTKKTYKYDDDSEEIEEFEMESINRFTQAQLDQKIKEAVDAYKVEISKKEASNIMDEILKKYSKASVEELVKFLESEIATLKGASEKQATELASKVQEITAKDTELATMKTEKEAMIKAAEESKLIVENAKIELEKIKAEFATIKADLDARLAAEKAAAVKVRKDQIGEYAKDMSDDDILNDLKFENAKLKKERDEALAKANAVVPAAGSTGVDAGKVIVNEDPNLKQREEIRTRAFGTEK